jgi:hypothetical protein
MRPGSTQAARFLQSTETSTASPLPGWAVPAFGIVGSGRYRRPTVRTADRVQERRRAVALARHYRDVEGLSIAKITRRLDRAPATVKAYLYDLTGEKVRAVKRRYQGVCRGCGAPTAARPGQGDAYEYCKRCHPGAIAPTRTRESVRDATRLATAVSRPVVVNGLVSHARTPAGRRSTPAATGSRLAGAVDGHRPARHLGGPLAPTRSPTAEPTETGLRRSRPVLTG